MNGWIKIHRSLIDSPVWTSANAEGRVILMTLLLSVTPTPYKSFWNGQEIVVQPGQIITSIEGICTRTGLLVTPQNVRTMLRKCKQAGFLTEEVTKTGRLITIANWGVYQSQGEDSNKNTNRQPTNVQQTSNMLATTNREDKEDKKIKNNSIFVPPSLGAVKAYCSERHNNVDAQRFIDFYESKGWMVGKNKMKDWKAAVRTWEKSDSGKNVQQAKNYIGRQYSDEFLAGLYKEV